MLTTKKITIVVVAFKNDIHLLCRFLTSVKTYCVLDQLDVIKIIINDSYSHNKFFENIKSRFHELPIEIVPALDVDSRLTLYNWNTQQYLKLVSARLVNTEWYIIHDCKDHYTDHVDFFSECFTRDGKAIIKLDHTNYLHNSRDTNGTGFFNLALDITNKIYNSSSNTHWHLPTVTPFFVKTEVMMKMIDDLEVRLEGFFPVLFSISVNEERIFTEFLLYSAFCTNYNKLNDYVDISYGTTYYSKIKQDKSLRAEIIPINPNLGQKFLLDNEIWSWDGHQWINKE